MISHNLTFYIFIFMLFFIFIISSLGFLTVLFDNCEIWTYGKSRPIVTVDARVVNKRYKTFHDAQVFGDMVPSYTFSTSFFITFEIDKEEKLEFSLTAVEFKNITEGDVGKLSYQGNRFLAFER